MKASRAVAFFLVAMALIMTGAGGMMDMLFSSSGSRGGGLYISREHAWNDGQFLVLLAIFIVLAF
jgi:hypothetical protein